jgi:hypothetical protein
MTRNTFSLSSLGLLSDVLTFSLMIGLTIASAAAVAEPLIAKPTPVHASATPIAKLPPVVVIVKRAS